MYILNYLGKLEKQDDSRPSAEATRTSISLISTPTCLELEIFILIHENTQANIDTSSKHLDFKQNKTALRP
jgi:hypothetical protein